MTEVGRQYFVDPDSTLQSMRQLIEENLVKDCFPSLLHLGVELKRTYSN
jgi:hypothetical protein